MKILVVSPTPTHPPNAGNRARILALSSTLQGLGHDVHFAFIRMESADESGLQAYWGDHYHPIPYSRPVILHGFLERMADRFHQCLDSSHSYTFRIDDWFDNTTLDFLRTLQRDLSFDAVIMEYVFISKALEAFDAPTLKILDTHDVFTDRHKLYLVNGSQPQWFSTTRRQEAKALSRSDAVIAIQEKESAFFSKLTTAQVITVGHLVRTEPLWYSREGGMTHDLLFVGSGNPINVESIEKFIRGTLPIIEEMLPDTRLLTAGTICDQIGTHPKLVKLGALLDIADAYRVADVVINPVHYGTGLSVKTVEALGFGMPMISTSVGAKGLGVEQFPLLVADSPEIFAQKAVQLLTDTLLAMRLSQCAIQFAIDWNARHCKSLASLLVPREIYQRNVQSPDD